MSSKLRSVTSYTHLRTISRGGMGRVDLVARREGDFVRLCAVKRLLDHCREDESCRRMFADEARIAGLVHHPNVVSVLDVGDDEDGPFLVMQYVEGVSLATLLGRVRAEGEILPVQLVLRVGHQIASGLQATHELVSPDGSPMHVIHRDISPQNILVGYDGVVRVTDFGIAKASQRSAAETTTGILKGKVGYMAPEQLRFEDPDHRADLFALGVILYELLSGERLYPGSEQEAARQILTGAMPDIEDARDDVPPGLVELLFELLSKDPRHRPESAQEVAHRLEGLLNEQVRQEGIIRLDEYMDTEFSERRARERAELAALMEEVPEDPTVNARTSRPWAIASLLFVVLAGIGGFAAMRFFQSSVQPPAPLVESSEGEPESSGAEASPAADEGSATESVAAEEPPQPSRRVRRPRSARRTKNPEPEASAPEPESPGKRPRVDVPVWEWPEE